VTLRGTGTHNTLNGYCVIHANNSCKYAQDLTSCPAGVQAITPHVNSCSFSSTTAYVTVDTSRACHVSSTQGECEVF
jgi:hypothetical protein